MGSDAARIAKMFIARSDVMAAQTAKGHYSPTREKGTKKHIPFTSEAVDDHIAGKKTYGHYLLHGDNCKLFAFDIDLDRGWYAQFGCAWPPGALHDQRKLMNDLDHPLRPELIRYLRSLSDGLANKIQRKIGIKTAVSFSGSKGLHVYGLYGERVSARSAMADAQTTIKCFEPALAPAGNEQNWKSRNFIGATIEIFPKQPIVKEGGYGNLMRLPLGINRKTGARSHFIDWTADPRELVEISMETAFSG